MQNHEIINKLGKDTLITLKDTIIRGHQLGLSYTCNSNILNVKSAKSNRQSVINYAIDYVLESACKDEILEFNCEYKFNRRGNCLHIELYRDDFIITHSSGNHMNFPRQALFRTDLSSNQLSLFDDVQYEAQYGILMHSSQLIPGIAPDVALGIPDINCCKWSNYINLATISNCAGSLIEVKDDIEKFEFALKSRDNVISKLG